MSNELIKDLGFKSHNCMAVWENCGGSLQTFTLDTNCLIDVADKRPAAIYVERLLAAMHEGKVDLALVASSASEKQQGGDFLSSLSVFNERRIALGFGSLPLLPSLGRYNVSFFDHFLWADDEGHAREGLIYSVLFPTSPHEWADYATAKGIDKKEENSPAYFRWRNQILDAQAFWAHDYARRNIFVTSDCGFKKLEKSGKFPDAAIKTPEEAAALIER